MRRGEVEVEAEAEVEVEVPHDVFVYHSSGWVVPLDPLHLQGEGV